MAYTNGKNGHNGHGPNGNGKSLVRRNIGLESLGFVIAEGVGMSAGLGVVAVADQVAPELVNAGCKVLSRTVVEPFLEPIENFLSKICKLEECKPDKNIERHERADRLSKVLVVFSASAVASYASRLFTRRTMNNLFKINESLSAHAPRTGWKKFLPSKKELAIFAVDDGLHYGLAAWMNMSQAGADYTDDMIRSTSKMLTKVFGLPEEKAHELAAYTMIWEVPNLAGMATGIGGIALSHKYPNLFGNGHGHAH